MKPVFEIDDIVTVISTRPNGTSKDTFTKGQIGVVTRIDENEGNPDPNKTFSYEVKTESDSIGGYDYFVNQLRLATDFEIKTKLAKMLKDAQRRV